MQGEERWIVGGREGGRQRWKGQGIEKGRGGEIIDRRNRMGEERKKRGRIGDAPHFLSLPLSLSLSPSLSLSEEKPMIIVYTDVYK